MGLFSYICPKCRKSIRYGEACVLRHVRHGELLGQASGTYDGYGRVMEDSSYRNNRDTGINGHDEIWKSEYAFTDSRGFREKIYEGSLIEYRDFVSMMLGRPWNEIDRSQIPREVDVKWKALPEFVPEHPLSGTSAYHKYCYERLTDEEKGRLVLSGPDPDQGCGKIREKYR